MNSKKIIFTAIASLLLIFLTIGLYIFLTSTSASKILPSQLRTIFPSTATRTLVQTNTATSSETKGNTLDLKVVGGTMLVNDFTKLPGVGTTSDSSFLVWLPDSASTTPDNALYEVFYLPLDQSFTVVLLKEPIAESRRKATADILAKLGISNTEVCALNAEVRVLYFVNDFYSAKNLGFPGCPGALRFDGD